MNTNIKNLLIDFGGVLIDLDRPRCLEAFRRLGMPNLEHFLDVCHQQDFFLLHEKGLIDDAEFRNRIREKIGKPLTDEQIDEAWNSFLLGIPSYKLELLLQLRRDYKVFLLSNTNDIHWQWSLQNAFTWQGHQAEDFFDRIFLSYQMKLAKPDVEIFRQVLAETDIRPEETFFIDDAPDNCRAAETLGIQTYTPRAQEDWSHLFR